MTTNAVTRYSPDRQAKMNPDDAGEFIRVDALPEYLTASQERIYEAIVRRLFAQLAVKTQPEAIEKLAQLERLAIALSYEKERSRRAGAAMWAAVDVIKAHIGPFDAWPDAFKEAFSWAIIDPDQTLTPKERARAQDVARKHGWLSDGAQPNVDSAEILSSERSTSSGPRDKASSLSSDGRAAALDAVPSSLPAVCTPEINAQIEAQIDHDKALFEAGYVHGQQCAADGGAVSRPRDDKEEETKTEGREAAALSTTRSTRRPRKP